MRRRGGGRRRAASGSGSRGASAADPLGRPPEAAAAAARPPRPPRELTRYRLSWDTGGCRRSGTRGLASAEGGGGSGWICGSGTYRVWDSGVVVISWHIFWFGKITVTVNRKVDKLLEVLVPIFFELLCLFNDDRYGFD